MEKQKIIMMQLDSIIPYENNPRHNEEAAEIVARSIKEFGFKNPIIVDKDNVVIAGHTRLKAAYKLGLKEAPVIVASDLTEDQVKAFRLVDNKTSELAVWNFEKLEEELADINLDMALFEFETVERDFNHIDELLEAGFGGGGEKKEADVYSISLSFPKEYEETLKEYIAENGKQPLIDLVLKEVGL